MKLAVLGARGLVGKEIIKIALEHNLALKDILFVSSDNQEAEKYINISGENHQLISIENALAEKPDFAIFATDDQISMIWAPQFAEQGTIVIDNSSAWRMNPNYKLIVPEVNGHLLTKNDKIIANPNCCVIQLVIAIAQIHKIYGIKRLVVSTYQSVSGGGRVMLEQFTTERNKNNVKTDAYNAYKPYNQRIDLNVIPQIGNFTEEGNTVEELKIKQETKKILCDGSINISSTCVRVPTIAGHGLAVNLELINKFELTDIEEVLSKSSQVVLHKEKFYYHTPYYVAEKNEVFVGRVRKDDSIENGLNMWVVADNLRRGAALNAWRIMEMLNSLKNK
jgi:aspartate-semialdehyde dehydrogenase